jgi:hypothetical protein
MAVGWSSPKQLKNGAQNIKNNRAITDFGLTFVFIDLNPRFQLNFYPPKPA